MERVKRGGRQRGKEERVIEGEKWENKTGVRALSASLWTNRARCNEEKISRYLNKGFDYFPQNKS